MATQQDQERPSEARPSTANVDDEKQDAAHKEFTAEILDEKNQTSDAFGAIKKTDAAEIKLVRKLDLWIMVRHFLKEHLKV